MIMRTNTESIYEDTNKYKRSRKDIQFSKISDPINV